MTRRTTSRAPEMFPGRQPSSHPNPCLGGVCSRYAGSERAPGRSWTAQDDGCQAGSRDGAGRERRHLPATPRWSRNETAWAAGQRDGRGPTAAPSARAHSTPSAHGPPGRVSAGPRTRPARTHTPLGADRQRPHGVRQRRGSEPLSSPRRGPPQSAPRAVCHQHPRARDYGVPRPVIQLRAVPEA